MRKASLAIAAFFSLATVASACVSMDGNVVVNNCNYRVMGNYKGSDGSWGGFGPIRAGGREATFKRRDAGWDISFFNYEAWGGRHMSAEGSQADVSFQARHFARLARCRRCGRHRTPATLSAHDKSVTAPS
ncbi:cytochrome c oxidase subunit III [Mesorhizobium ciceri]|uniref:Cytochrome c oxidase, subunit III n=1 Tax=Mesorhizobium ciceri biovar biserrulae (strain HAMBI 2942 / LMG 23838 / WSM1271) TaxID=765698 RepID=E8TLX5_MESCW|nr:cytochrome c oxidase subunit III [Mesorhizobium ciceri]ADV10360.1 cytochrome c oxidase, subunit III [Mesorhizobium ciceri biovar biserrulae WSM1271]